MLIIYLVDISAKTVPIWLHHTVLINLPMPTLLFSIFGRRTLITSGENRGRGSCIHPPFSFRGGGGMVSSPFEICSHCKIRTSIAISSYISAIFCCIREFLTNLTTTKILWQSAPPPPFSDWLFTPLQSSLSEPFLYLIETFNNDSKLYWAAVLAKTWWWR